jgi:deazaflavin-dependent oxidoreductase (nitroreductase family)
MTDITPEQMKSFNDQQIDEFRANGGSTAMFGNAMVLLTTTGAKTGRTLTSPLVYGTDGDTVFVIASKAGAPSNPSWFHNLVANTGVTVEIGTQTYEATAEVCEESERARLYAIQAAARSAFAEYAAKTDRVIPVVVLKGVPAPR